MRIIVEGLIGVGKSTFTEEASKYFNLNAASLKRSCKDISTYCSN